jgi:hypothetical protein
MGRPLSISFSFAPFRFQAVGIGLVLEFQPRAFSKDSKRIRTLEYHHAVSTGA